MNSFQFWSRVRRDPSGCWLWTGSRASNGYGTLRFGDRYTSAHAVAARMVLGPKPDGTEVCHRCDVRLCVNPAHLFYGTRLDNVRDMWAKGRASAPPPKSAHTPESRRASSLRAWETRRARAAA